MDTPGTMIGNVNLKGDYYAAAFCAPEIASKARAGQFVHVRIDDTRNDWILRRPFSICDTDPEKGTVTIVYKVVGKGTAALSGLRPGSICDIMGPLGSCFTPPPDATPVAVCGGYGAAATFMLTRGKKGVLLLGARSEADVILTDKYEKAGFDVRIATNDGSAGTRGFVTELVPRLLEERPQEKFFFCACGPHPMLMALARLLREIGQSGQLSIDHRMCCGVGSCFACVVKVNDPGSADGWRYARSCAEGPVFNLEDVYTGD
ncbi:MAG: dihydroorotate dehydrogenase electron transfer subunit [Lentisphaeria bacterium]|nr:dihydroorotate dehydrogenase electron transfer subunit [Lentisphaeria bacterium]